MRYLFFLGWFCLSVSPALGEGLGKPVERYAHMIYGQKTITEGRCKFGLSVPRLVDEFLSESFAAEAARETRFRRAAYLPRDERVAFLQGYIRDSETAAVDRQRLLVLKAAFPIQQKLETQGPNGATARVLDAQIDFFHSLLGHSLDEVRRHVLRGEEGCLLCLDAHHATEEKLRSLSQVFFAEVRKEFPEVPKADSQVVAELVAERATQPVYEERLIQLFQSSAIPELPMPMGSAFEAVTAENDPFPAAPFWRSHATATFKAETAASAITFGQAEVPTEMLAAYWAVIPRILFGSGRNSWITEAACAAAVRGLRWGAYFGMRAEPASFIAWQISRDAFTQWMRLIFSLGSLAEMRRAPRACADAFTIAYRMWPRVRGFEWVEGFETVSASYPDEVTLTQSYPPGWQIRLSFLKSPDKKTDQLRWAAVVPPGAEKPLTRKGLKK